MNIIFHNKTDNLTWNSQCTLDRKVLMPDRSDLILMGKRYPTAQELHRFGACFVFEFARPAKKVRS